MSETKLISPLLDGFAMGNPISDHHGIRCCPAIKENTDKKYIVKVISIPASQVQMDALLLAGAYKDPSEAMEYFQSKAEEVLQEAELLKTLSGQEGFLSYEGWQIEPITRYRLGYEVYLVGSYKRSLEKYIRHNAMTHLEAVNLGLDMCSALSACRKAGALYVDLKPSNIFMSEKKEYRIGDLGFISMDTLRYAALPDKYLSSYTPPELYDPMANVNMTVDTYALGMILYQLYNDGTLPFKGKAPEEALPAPVQADYELAEIILKAIDPDPEKRWTDPADMEKALASYMQRNSVNDTPITPLRTKKLKPKKKKPQEIPEASEDSTSQESVDDIVPAADALPEEIQTEGVPPEVSSPEAVNPEIPEEESLEAEAEAAAESEDSPLSDSPEPEAEEISSDETINAEEKLQEKSDQGADTEQEIPSPEEPEPIAVSEELSRILAKADDLISHETPQGVQFTEVPEAEDPFAFATEDSEDTDDSDIPYDPLMDEEPEPVSKKKKKEKKFADPKYKRRKKRFIRFLIALLILALMVLGAFWYYQNLYLLNIHDLTITGGENKITVLVNTDAKDDQLLVSCLDHYGNTKTAQLQDGKAEFTGLQSNTMYTIRLDAEGFHDLVGKTSDVFTTEATTSIISFTSVGGAEDGSVVLSFSVDGDEPEHWSVIYGAEGEETITKTFTGHSVTISGLSLGKLYTFTLDAGDRLSLGGEKSLSLMASRLILAENLCVTSENGNDIAVTWKAPGDIVVESWDVRCYNDIGYDQQYTVQDPYVVFSGIDTSFEHHIEVTAAGMTQPARTGITANPISIQSLTVDESKEDSLQLSWDILSNVPEGGWLVLYNVGGGENSVVKTTGNTAQISPKLPGGKYTITVQSADGTSVFNNVHSFTVAEAQSFEANGLSADMLTVDLLKTPDDEKWYYENITDSQLTTDFVSGDSISIVLRSSDSFYLPGYQTKVLYVIRDAYGNILPQYVHEDQVTWKSIWAGGDSKNGELNVPSVPTIPGEYVLNLYFDSMSVAELPFTIAE